MTIRPILILTLFASATISTVQAQYFGTVWKGRVMESGEGRTWDIELKLIDEGDSVKGYSYYQGAWYNRLVMPVKGYVDPSDGRLSWWHDSPFGFDEQGRRAPDPMPPGIQYTLGFSRQGDRTESLQGIVSMSIWSRERWEREVRLERAADSPFEDQWIGGLMEKGKKNTAPKTSTAGTKAGKKSATPSPANQPKPVAAGTTTSPPSPPRAVEQPLTKDEPKAVKPAIVQKAPVKPPSANVGMVSTKKQGVPSKPTPSTSSVSIVEPPPPVQNKTQAKSNDPSAIKPVKDPLSTSGKTTIPDTEVKPPPQPSHGEGEVRTETIRTPISVASDAMLPPLLSRQRILVEEIDILADTLWLNFYDPAEVDGDTVSIYLGDKPIAERVGLGLDAHLISIPVSSLPEWTELTMFAENLGSMPPNTALLVLYMGDVRREIRLESTDRMSAAIRFKKQMPPTKR